MTPLILNKLPPSLNHAYYFIRKGPRTFKVKTKECQAWIKYVHAELEKQKIYEWGLNLAANKIVTIDFTFPNNIRRDIMNFDKVMLDALIGKLYADDSQIIDLHIRKYIIKGKSEVEIEVKDL